MEEELISLDRKGLQEFVRSERFLRLDHIPISTLRSISHISNPRAKDDDILLVAVLSGDTLIGYLGALPDDFQNSKGEWEHFAWLSCFWVREDYKEKNIAAMLFMEMAMRWRRRLMITNIVPTLESVYQGTRLFRPTHEAFGTRYYLRLNLHTILPPKRKIFALCAPTLRIADGIANTFIGLFKKHETYNIKAELPTPKDQEIREFIDKNIPQTLCKRSSKEIEWIMQNPWISAEASKEEAKKYYFSLYETLFSQQLFKVYDDKDEITAVVMINIRKGCMTVPFYFCKEEWLQTLAKFVSDYALCAKADMLTVFCKELDKAISATQIKSKSLHSKQIRRPYFISKALDTGENPVFQDGDGDCCFC